MTVNLSELQEVIKIIEPKLPAAARRQLSKDLRKHWRSVQYIFARSLCGHCVKSPPDLVRVTHEQYHQLSESSFALCKGLRAWTLAIEDDPEK